MIDYEGEEIAVSSFHVQRYHIGFLEISVDNYVIHFLFINVWRCSTISELMINEQIRDREVRLIGVNGEQLGIMSARDAMKLAREAELDLVKVAPLAKPPVCKIIDYGKYRYELARKEKEAKKKQKTIEIKEIRLSPNIDVNDLNTKATSARKFLTKGNKVKISLRFRGREMAHMQANRYILEDFAKQLEDVAVMDKPIKQEGRSLTMFLSEKRS
jgi:translation initiation factor IF-3